MSTGRPLGNHPFEAEVTVPGRDRRRARQASSPTSQAPIARRAVLSATEELSELASELVAPGPVGAGGVAQVQLLISDGTGPLYNPHSGIDLTTAVRRAIEALRLYRRQPAW